MKLNKKLLGLGSALMLSSALFAQDADKITNKEGSEFEFTVIKDMEANEVPSQGRTGTCWSFSTLSFFESELLRKGKGKHNLSEMFIVRHAYVDKAENYVRMHGNFNFGAGGAFHDIPHVIEKYGMVPQEVYQGLDYTDGETHNHAEMDEVLTAMVKAVVKNPQKTLTPKWKDAIGATVDAYLGEIPEEFKYKGKLYTPASFAKSLDLSMDDYVALSSYTHVPYYKPFVLEVPDNWAFGQVYNLPIDELMETMENAVMNEYTFAWAADVSEKGFSFRDGLAIVPEDEESIKKKGKDNKHFNDAGAEKQSTAFETPMPEKKITAEMRQKAYDNYETTDDHGMHITGLVKDQKGSKYFIVKNSWGTKYNDCDGYFYASYPYAKYKTMDILLHKDAIPSNIKKKLGIK